MYKPSWFRNGEVLIVNARTCGINKDGFEQFKVDSNTGKRTEIIDNELSELTDLVRDGQVNNGSVAYVKLKAMKDARTFVPSYYDNTTTDAVNKFVKSHPTEFEAKTIADLISGGVVNIRYGHGSPSSDQRVGDIPYIKVSDLRAGQLNINPTNRIPRQLAERFWRGKSSGLKAFDLISPERASKNIGEFCVLMPGQEEIVITKEVIILRSVSAKVSQFYLMWALSLSVVRRQWERIVFMQTNREDVGDRVLEIIIPYPKNASVANKYSAPFHGYFNALNSAKQALRQKLDSQGIPVHLFFA